MSLNQILSPKIVQTNGAYSTKVDIQNVDTITCNTLSGPVSFNTNCGTATIVSGQLNVSVINDNVTTNSIIMITPTDVSGGNNGYYITTSNGSFTITIIYTSGTSTTFNYFIAKY